MITKILAYQRYKANHVWLQSYHLFSFADYHDPENIQFGNLRVFNDDTIAGQSGFSAHSHSNMEIVTLVFNGKLTHKDSMGNEGIISPGEVQYMSAGTGVTHAELNEHDETVQLYQIWMMPRNQNLVPKYGQKDFASAENNALIPVVSGFKEVVAQSNAIPIESNTTIYISNMTAGASLSQTITAGHGMFVYITSGEIEVNGIKFEAGDQGRITNEDSLDIKAISDVKFIAIETELKNSD